MAIFLIMMLSFEAEGGGITIRAHVLCKDWPSFMRSPLSFFCSVALFNDKLVQGVNLWGELRTGKGFTTIALHAIS